MTTFWCAWCGETTEGESTEDRIACRRCAKEFFLLLGWVPRTEMTPLAEGESPGVPAAARKQFVFVDAQTGMEAGRTEVAPRAAGQRRRPA